MTLFTVGEGFLQFSHHVLISFSLPVKIYLQIRPQSATLKATVFEINCLETLKTVNINIFLVD